jgi:hypothetical protein
MILQKKIGKQVHSTDSSSDNLCSVCENVAQYLDHKLSSDNKGSLAWWKEV